MRKWQHQKLGTMLIIKTCDELTLAGQHFPSRGAFGPHGLISKIKW